LGSMMTRCRALYHYAKYGKQLVYEANKKGFDWSLGKKWFVDDVMSKKTSEEAVTQYSLACKKLCEIVAPHLWDERVMKSSVWDFFKFIIPVLADFGWFKCYIELFYRTIRGKLTEAYNG
jgi:hypothetical protein